MNKARNDSEIRNFLTLDLSFSWLQHFQHKSFLFIEKQFLVKFTHDQSNDSCCWFICSVGMTFKGKNKFKWSKWSTFLFFSFINNFSKNSSFFHQNGINGWEDKLHQLAIRVETSYDIQEGFHCGFWIVVDFLSLDCFVLLSDSQEIFDRFGFKKFLMLLEVVETHFDSCGDFTKSFFFHIETHRIMMIAFWLDFGSHF